MTDIIFDSGMYEIRGGMVMVKPDFLRKKTPQEKQEHREMVKQIVRSCLVSSAIVLVCIILFELFFYINSIQHPKSFGKLLVW